MTRTAATATTARCSIRIEREHEQLYHLDCSCGTLNAIHATRDSATRTAIRHGEQSGHGYSITNR